LVAGHVAICGNSPDVHWLRLFDIRIGEPYSATLAMQLERTKLKNHWTEVNHPSFSPDGNLLVIPRSDNVTHVYDARFMSTKRGPMMRLPHDPSKAQVDANGSNHYGIVNAVWVDGLFGCPGQALLTGGNDGKLRSSFRFLVLILSQAAFVFGT
jgi:WD40 repeat protein